MYSCSAHIYLILNSVQSRIHDTCWSGVRFLVSSTGVIDLAHIFSNDLEYSPVFSEDASSMVEVSSGRICQHIKGASGKLGTFDSIVDRFKLSNGEYGCNHWQHPVTIYVGDSSTDALALEKADIGIIVGSSASLRKALQFYNVPVLSSSRFDDVLLSYKDSIHNHMSSFIFEAPEDYPFDFIRKVVGALSEKTT